MSPFDPGAARDRLARAARAAREALEPGPAATRRLLEERARQLARPVVEAGPAAGLEVLAFRVGEERLAIDTRVCREVVREVEPLAVPGLPAWLPAVLLHRGDVLPLVDPGTLLGIARPAATAAARALVLGRQGPELALSIDLADETLRLDEAGLRPPPPRADALIRGLGPGALVLLSGEALLADPRLRLEEAR